MPDLLLDNLRPLLTIALIAGLLGLLWRAGELPWSVDIVLAALVLAGGGYALWWLALALVAVARRWRTTAQALAQVYRLPDRWYTRLLLPGADVAHVAQAGAPATGETRRLSPAEWLRWANDDPTAPHTAITGPTRSGKTTLALALLGRRQGRIVVCTPKPPSEDGWGGTEAVRISFDNGTMSWAPIAQAIKAVYDEMTRRYAADMREPDGTRPDPITLVIDEFSNVVAECREVRDWVLRLWSMAAAARIRVIVIDPEVNVKAWGIEGRGGARDNLLFVEVDDRRQARMYRWGKEPRGCDTRPVLRLAQEALLFGREWVCPVPAPGGAISGPGNTGNGTGTGNGAGTETGTSLEVLRELRAAGWTRDRARQSGCKFRDSDWTAAAPSGG